MAIVKRVKEITFDSKRRVYLPRKDRVNLGETVIVKIEGEQLLLFTEEEWREQTNRELVGLRGADFRRRQRRLFSSVFQEKIDRQGRLRIPFQLIRGGRN